MKQKVNLTAFHPSKIFYGYVYPLTAKEFLFMNNYEQYANNVVAPLFVLTPEQWEVILNEWEFKERLLSSPIENNLTPIN